jgi:hypothetical protein
MIPTFVYVHCEARGDFRGRRFVMVDDCILDSAREAHLMHRHGQMAAAGAPLNAAANHSTTRSIDCLFDNTCGAISEDFWGCCRTTTAD